MTSADQDRTEEEPLANDTVPDQGGQTMALEEGADEVHTSAGGSSSAGDQESADKTLARADELFAKGSKAIEDGEFVEAVDSLSRALEIRVSHFGELAQECASAYYKYGCALLYKAQEEADPLGNFPKTSPANDEKSTTSSCAKENGGSSKDIADVGKDSSSLKDEEPEGEGSNKDSSNDADESEDDEEDTAEADEDESDLDLAWKMLDVARAIVEKQPGDTMEKVNILAALAEVSMEREDIDTSLDDYLKALAILENLVEPGHRRIVELNFRISLVLELGSRISEAIPYCEKAITLCKSRLVRLKEDENVTAVTGASESSMLDSEKNDSAPAKEIKSTSNLTKDIEFFTEILSELEKKLEDLQQLLATPRSVFSDSVKLIASKLMSGEKNAPSASTTPLTSLQMGAVNSGGFDSPTLSTAATNGAITDLGVVGRGVKRATINPSIADPQNKRFALDNHTENATDHSDTSAVQDAEDASK
ncbi:NASP-related protein sim3-like [Zingiber officinale]|uniref:NASP-related protein sim3-like n=1 Tax=Zingiber officinale TaxID=94328 RepID=UPI001C4DC68F|nr:NASP-related protein sim3-like [Zingiber officinale]